jgi:signal transduction histidine kinase
MKMEPENQQSRGRRLLPRLDPRFARAARPLCYAVGITLVLFGLYEVVERLWLTGIEMHVLHLLHILRGVASTLIVAGVVSWMIIKSSPGFLDSSLTGEWERHPRPTEAERAKSDARWFIAMRWIAVLIAALLVFIIVKVLKWLPNEVWWPLFGLVGLLAACNVVCAVLVDRERSITRLLQVQGYVDLAILTGLLHFSGGVENPLSMMMIFHVIIGGVLLSPRLCYGIAAGATVFFGLMVWAEWSGLVQHYTLQIFPHYHEGHGELLHPAHDPLYAMSRVGLHAAVLFLTAYFVTTLAERLRENEQRLETMAERALAGRQLLEQALETTGTGLRVLNRDLHPFWTTTRWNEWFRCAPGQTCAGFERLNGPDSPAQQTLTDGETRITELLLEEAGTCPSAEVQPAIRRAFQIATAPLRDLSGTIQQIVELAQDCTIQKQTQTQMIRAGKLAAVGELAGQVAHEVNNPIAIISAKASLLLLDHREDMSEKVAEEVRKIFGLATRVARIAQGLLSSCRPAAGSRVLLDIRVPIRKSLVVIDEHARRAGVRIEEQFPEKLPPVHANSQELEQVFLNLVLNAIDAMPKGGWLKIYTPPEPLELPHHTPALAVVFEDTGCGIPDGIRERIFEPFFTTKKEERGTGLGLSICQGLICSHGGDIAIESKIWQGTRVTVRLPAAPATAPAPMEATHG